MLKKRFTNFFDALLKLITAASIMITCLFCSCSELETTSPQDYIGPAKQAAEPNVLPPKEIEKPSVPKFAPSELVKIEPTGPLNITINEAVLISLERNKSLVVQKLNPQISRAAEQQAVSVFDPNFTGSFLAGKSRSETMPRPGLGAFKETTRTQSLDAAVNELFPTGTLLSLVGSTDTLDGSFLQQPFVTTRLGLSVTQPILRGFGPAVNLVAVNQAKIDIKISQYELRGFVESLVAQVEETYWNYLLAQKSIEIYTQSLQLAQDQQKQTEEQIRVGSLAASELVTAKAEVALRRQNLIVADNNLAQTRLTLLQLLNPQGPEMWNRDIAILSDPEIPAVELGPVEPFVQRGLQLRPEIKQAKLQIERDDLDVVRTRNGLLPQLDFFIALGKTGYADSFEKSTREIFKKNYDALAGVNFEYPPINRLARAQNQQALLSKQQAMESLDNLQQTIEVDVRGAYLQITNVQQLVAAAKASRELQEEKYNVEVEKFKVGKSISLLVAQAQRDLLQSRITEIRAIIGYQIAIVELYRLEGTLLLRSGIASPGVEHVEITKDMSN